MASPDPVFALAAEVAHGDQIVGHKTVRDEATGKLTHEPLTRAEADALWAAAEAAKAKRATDMPDVASALSTMFQAHQRLLELGWRDAIYCPKDGTVFDAIEAGSTGVHDCWYEGEWPDGRWWLGSGFDVGPSHPILFRLKEAEPARMRKALEEMKSHE